MADVMDQHDIHRGLSCLPAVCTDYALRTGGRSLADSLEDLGRMGEALKVDGALRSLPPGDESVGMLLRQGTYPESAA